MLKVTADIFSGRPNPEWIVADQEADAAIKELAAKESAIATMESGFQGLGNRGLIVEILDDHIQSAHGLPTSFRLAGGGSRAESHARDIAERLISAMTEQEAGSHPSLARSVEPGMHLPLDATLRKFVLEGLPASAGGLMTVEPVTIEDAQAKAEAAVLACAYEAGAFNPGFWNVPAHISRNNCYNYATNRRTDTFAQPGRASGHMYTAIKCAEVTKGALSDGASLNCAPASQAPRWYMALVIAPGPGFVDYHWYRKSKECFWGHKPGGTAARNVDNSGRVITDPRTANRGPYTVFCGFMYAQKKMVVR